jgi:hypothetical protein
MKLSNVGLFRRRNLGNWCKTAENAVWLIWSRDYAEIANWLTGQLAKELAGKKIRRGQVYRVYQQWLEQSEAESWGHIGGVRAISEEEAEKEAEIEDKKPPESTEEKKP